MRKIFGPAVALLCLAIYGSAQDFRKEAKGTPQKGPCDAAMTQLYLNQCYGEQFQKADAHVDKLYASFLKQTRGDTAIQRVKTVEKAWIRYRDLHCEAAKSEVEGGSISPMVWSQCMTMTTEHRIEELKAAYQTGERKLE